MSWDNFQTYAFRAFVVIGGAAALALVLLMVAELGVEVYQSATNSRPSDNRSLTLRLEGKK